MAETKKLGFATRAIHDGQAPDELTGAVNVPIYLTSTYKRGSAAPAFNKVDVVQSGITLKY